MSTKRLNIHEAKTHLSRVLEDLEPGEVILLCKRNVPIAEIHPVVPRREARRPTGLAAGTFDLPSSFFQPLPDDLLEAFDGGGTPTKAATTR